MSIRPAVSHRACLIALFALAGCRESPKGLAILDPLGIGRGMGALLSPPLRIGATTTDYRQFCPEFERDLGRELGRIIQSERLKPFQIKAHLEDGRLQFALVGAAEAGEVLSPGDGPQVVAVPVFREDGRQRRGVILASAKSSIREIADLKGKRFSFGPAGHPTLHLGALKTLAKGGVKVTDLHRELTPLPVPLPSPIPGLMLQHHFNSFESAKAIVYELGTEAGVVDEVDYNSWPQTGGTFIPTTFSRDQVRILARTEAVPTLPDGPVLVSADADPQLVAGLKTYLTRTLSARKKVLDRLGVERFEEASAFDLPPTPATTQKTSSAASE